MSNGFWAFFFQNQALSLYPVEYGYDHREPQGQSTLSGLGTMLSFSLSDCDCPTLPLNVSFCTYFPLFAIESHTRNSPDRLAVFTNARCTYVMYTRT